MSAVTNPVHEQPIRKLLEKWVEALRARDIDRLMSFYAPGAVLFDGIAPLRVDFETYRKNWRGFFEWFPGPPAYEARDVRIVAGDSVAFASALVRLVGTTAEGKEEGAWMRQTIGLERDGGSWLITHEHWSLPIDMESGKGLTNLLPE